MISAPSAPAQVDWSDVYNSVDASEAYWLFSEKFSNIYTVSRSALSKLLSSISGFLFWDTVYIIIYHCQCMHGDLIC